MIMLPNQKCLICNSDDCEIGYDLDICHNYQFCYCSQCGKYILGGDKFRNTYYFPYLGAEKNFDCLLSMDKLQAYMFYHKSDSYILLGNKDIFDEYSECKFKYTVKNVTKEEIENWYPKSINEKINLILLHLNKMSRFDGDKIMFSFDSLTCLCFTICDDSKEKNVIRQYKLNQINFVLETLVGMDYIKWQYVDENKLNYSNRFICLTAKGLARVYDLQKTQQTNKDVFVAMSFHKSANDIRQAIKKGIEDAQYSSLLMDEIYHNHQIVPEMMRLIKESRFMIMDITQPNFGAYYEAGYAQGLGKEVIVTCSEEVWNQKDFACDKDKSCRYKEIGTKPHFDIAQKQVLVWTDYNDLSKKLAEWIRHLIG